MTIDMLLSSVRRSWYLVLAGLLLGVLVTYAAQMVLPKKYEASSLLLLSAPKLDQPSESSDYVEARMPTYAALITSRPVIDGAIKSLGLTQSSTAVAERVSVDVEVSTLLIKLTAEAPSAQAAAALANAVADSYSTLAPELDNADRPVLSVNVVEEALPPEKPSGLSLATRLLIGAVIGLTLGLLAALSRGAFPSRISRVDDVAQATGCDVVAVVGLSQQGEGGEGVATDSRHSPRVQAAARHLDSFPALYSRLGLGVFSRSTDRSDPHVVVVVSTTMDNDAALVSRGLVATCVASGQNCVALTPNAEAHRIVSEGVPDAGSSSAPGHATVLQADEIVGTDNGVLTLHHLESALRTAPRRPDVVVIAALPMEADANTRTFVELGDDVVLTTPLTARDYQSLQRSARLIREAGVSITGVVVTTSTARSDTGPVPQWS